MILGPVTVSEAASEVVGLRGGCLDVGQAGEVVGRVGQFEPELVARPAQVARLVAGADRLDPSRTPPRPACAGAGCGRNPDAGACADRSRCADLVRSGRPVECSQTAQVPDEVARVVGPVGAHGRGSPDDTLAYDQGRVADWISFGSRLGWVVDPINMTDWVYRPGREPERLERPQRLGGRTSSQASASIFNRFGTRSTSPNWASRPPSAAVYGRWLGPC